MVDSITIETSTRCNGRCLICPNRYNPRPEYLMPLSEFRAILEFFPRLKGVVLCGMYEPLADYRLANILDSIHYVQPFAEVTIFTNGSLLTSNVQNLLVSKPFFKNLVVSMHGFSTEVHWQVMGLDPIAIRKNVLDFIALKKERPDICVSVSFVRIKQNVHELAAFRQFWQGKVDRVSDFEVCSWQGRVPVENLYPSKPKGKRPCPMFEQPLVIDAYGNIVLCCYCFWTNYGHVLKGGYQSWLNKKRVSDTFPLPECEKCNGWTFP